MSAATAFAVVLVTIVAAPPAPRPDATHHRLWQLRPTVSDRRWIVVHAVETTADGELFHVDVVARPRRAPAWQVRHLAPHLAVTAAALQRSVAGPLTRGDVYPEAFDAAYRAWQAARPAGRADICATTIDECLDHR